MVQTSSYSFLFFISFYSCFQSCLVSDTLFSYRLKSWVFLLFQNAFFHTYSIKRSKWNVIISAHSQSVSFPGHRRCSSLPADASVTAHQYTWFSLTSSEVLFGVLIFVQETSETRGWWMFMQHTSCHKEMLRPSGAFISVLPELSIWIAFSCAFVFSLWRNVTLCCWHNMGCDPPCF